MQNIDGCRITIAELADEIHGVGEWLRVNFAQGELDPDGTECRLNVRSGSWGLLSGDPCYDVDHRGYWGASFIERGCSWVEAHSIARDLINEAADAYAQDIAGNVEDLPFWDA